MGSFDATSSGMLLAERVTTRYMLASRQMKPPLTKRQMGDLVDTVVDLARENARETEGVGKPDKSKPYDLEWEARVDKWIRPSIESILASIQNPRECNNYGLEKPLTERQWQEVAKKCRARDRY
jgi:hypothetical protein